LLGYSVTAFVATIGTRCGKYILLLANNCGNVHVRFSTFFILENVGKIKKRKKTFFTSMVNFIAVNDRDFGINKHIRKNVKNIK